LAEVNMPARESVEEDVLPSEWRLRK
jgi:hypothetical protein